MRDYNTDPANILLVEDNPAEALLTEEAFKQSKLNNNLFIVGDGELALDFLNKRNSYEDAVTPDLILLDLNLPKVDGREVLAHLKLHDHLSRIPVIVLTSSALEKDVMSCYDNGANSYIVKPMELDKFIKIVESIAAYWFSMSVLPEA